MSAGDYPEHDKLSAVKDASQAIGEFLDTCGMTLCRWHEAGDNGEPRIVWRPSYRGPDGCGTYRDPVLSDVLNGWAMENPAREEWDEGFLPVMLGIERVLADHFGIDLDKIEAEKRAILEAIRSAA